MARMNRVFLVVALLGIGALAILQPACTPEPKIGGRETIPADKLDKILAVFNRGVALMEQYQPQKAVTAFEQAVRRVGRGLRVGRRQRGITAKEPFDR